MSAARNRHVHEAPDYLHDDVLFTKDEMKLGNGVRNKAKTPEALWDDARAAQADYESVLDKVRDAVKGKDFTDFEEAMKFVGSPGEGNMVIRAPIKDMKRAVKKVNAAYGGDWNRLHDVLRSSVAVDSPPPLP